MMSSSTPRRFRLVLALGGLSGCWTSAQHGDSRDQRQALEQQKQALDAQLPKMDQKLQEVGEALDRLNQATHKSGADVSVRLDEFEEKLQQLRGTLEETQHRLDQMTSAEQQAQKDSDLKLAAALGPQALAAATAKEQALKMAPSDRPGLYAMAYEQLQQKSYDVARELFLEFLRRYPKDPQAGEAQYGVGQTYYQAARYKEAAVAFGKIPDTYPQSAKVCEARLGLGLSLAALKLKDDAKAALDETLNRCGGKVAVAKEARARLAELKKRK